MLHPAVIIPLLSLAFAACPTDYKDGGNGVCYKVFTQQVPRPNASQACAQDGAFLASIPNAFINSLIQSDGRSANLQGLWIGLTCQTNNYQSCIYDGATNFLDTSSYTNFYPGYPNVNTGTCVYMSTIGSSTGKWFTADCEETIVPLPIAYACAYNGNNVNGCSAGYTLLNNQCYKVIPSRDEPSAETICESDCGYITSILSHEENVFVRSLAYNSSVRNLAEIYVRIGLKTNGPGTPYLWEDGTPLGTYSNFGLMNQNLGNCVAMALQEDIVYQGEWINTKCDLSYISVCKKNMGNYCYSTVPSATLSPVYCQGTYTYTDNGTIYSPGYPGLTVPNKCDYVMIAPVGFLVRIGFPEMILDCDSQIELYNDLTDTTPFAVITSPPSPNNYYYSNENEMKMIFVATNGILCATGDKWVAEFEFVRQDQVRTTASPVVTSGCNQGLLLAPRSINSPNYPQNYPDNTDCNYLLGAPTNRHVTLHFVEIFTELGYDVITVYDGSDQNSRVLAQLSGLNPSVPDYTSSGNRMFVNFHSDNSGNYKGFLANFTSTP